MSVYPIPFPDLKNESKPTELRVGDRIVDCKIISVEILPDEHHLLFGIQYIDELVDNVKPNPDIMGYVINISSDDDDGS